jgi:hypothetical protein
VKIRSTWRYRGKTIRTRTDPKVGTYYIVDEYQALGKGFKKRRDARAAIDAVIDFGNQRRGERGPKAIDAKIEYRGRIIVRIADSKRGSKRYRVERFSLDLRPYVSVDAAVAAIDEAMDALEAAGTLRNWDELPFNDNK